MLGDRCTSCLYGEMGNWGDCRLLFLLDPPTSVVGPIDSLSLVHVRPSVRLAVSNKFFSATNHRISLIFCIKIAFNKTKKVTKPDF